jgi:hypothetical protein
VVRLRTPSSAHAEAALDMLAACGVADFGVADFTREVLLIRPAEPGVRE